MPPNQHNSKPPTMYLDPQVVVFVSQM